MYIYVCMHDCVIVCHSLLNLIVVVLLISVVSYIHIYICDDDGDYVNDHG